MMKSLSVRLQVQANGEVTLSALPPMQPGDYEGILVIEAAQGSLSPAPLNLPILDLGPWPSDLSLSRETFYSDDGR